MTNEKLLNRKINESGKKKGYLAERCGLSRQGFYNCIKGKSDFDAGHITVLCEELSIKSLREKESIFFAKSDSLNESNTPNA